MIARRREHPTVGLPDLGQELRTQQRPDPVKAVTPVCGGLPRSPACPVCGGAGQFNLVNR
jgi:hypothetical protein